MPLKVDVQFRITELPFAVKDIVLAAELLDPVIAYTDDPSLMHTSSPPEVKDRLEMWIFSTVLISAGIVMDVG